MFLYSFSTLLTFSSVFIAKLFADICSGDVLFFCFFFRDLLFPNKFLKVSWNEPCHLVQITGKIELVQPVALSLLLTSRYISVRKIAPFKLPLKMLFSFMYHCTSSFMLNCMFCRCSSRDILLIKKHHGCASLAFTNNLICTNLLLSV